MDVVLVEDELHLAQAAMADRLDLHTNSKNLSASWRIDAAAVVSA